MMDQPAPSADMKPHVIPLSRHAVDVARGDAHQARQVGSPEFLKPLRWLAGSGLGAALSEIGASAIERSLKAVGIDRLHQIIHRLDLKGRNGELIEGRYEHDGGRGGL